MSSEKSNAMPREREPVYMQLYAALDDASFSTREHCTQFVMDASKDRVADAIDFLNQEIVSELWGVSSVQLVGVVPLASWEDRQVRPREILSSFPLERVFVQGHQDCLVVVASNEPVSTRTASVDVVKVPIATTGGEKVPVTYDDSGETTHEEEEDNPENEQNKAIREDTDQPLEPTPVQHDSGVAAVAAAGTLAGLAAATKDQGDKETAPVDAALDSSGNAQVTKDESADMTGLTDAVTSEEGGSEEEERDVCSPFASAIDTCLGSNEDKEAIAGQTNEEKFPSAPESPTGRGIPTGPDEDEDEHFDVRKTIAALEAKSHLALEEEEDQHADLSRAVPAAAGVAAAAAPPETTENSAPAVARAAGAASAPQASSKDDMMPVESDERKVAAIPSLQDENGAEFPAVLTGAANSAPAVPDAKGSILRKPSGVGDVGDVKVAAAKVAAATDDSAEKIEEGIMAEGAGQAAVPAQLEDMNGMDPILASRSIDTPTSVAMAIDAEDKKMPAKDFGAVKEEASPDAKMKSAPVSKERARDPNAEELFKAELPPSLVNSNRVSKYGVAGDVGERAGDGSDDDVPSTAASFDNVVLVDLPGNGAKEVPLDRKDETKEPDAVYGVDMDPNDESWQTEPELDDSNAELFANVDVPDSPIPKKIDADAPVVLPSLLGTAEHYDHTDADESESDMLPDSPKPVAPTVAPPGVPQVLGTHDSKQQAHASMTYKIGSTYFLLRERDGVEYPVKILSLGKRGTCIVAYEHHRAKKKIRTVNLLQDTPERRQKFQEATLRGEIANDLPSRISKEVKERQTERHARHDERRKFGHHVTRDSIPECSTEGTLLEYSNRRIYFAKDKETVKEIGKKFNVPSERIVYDNKSAYPTLKKNSRLRPLTSIVLPPSS